MLNVSRFHLIPFNQLPSAFLIYSLKTKHSHSHTTKYIMDKLYLRHEVNSEELHMNFRYTNKAIKVDREFNFCRKFNENIDNALQRIRQNLEKELTKKIKKGKKKSPAQVQEPITIEGTVVNEVLVELRRKGKDEIISDITFSDLLKTSIDGLELQILNHSFKVVLNQPWVINLTLPTTILAGFPIYPSKLETQFDSSNHTRLEWFIAKKPPSGDLEHGVQWVKCGEGFYYTVTNNFIGYHLKIIVTPVNAEGVEGPCVEMISTNEIQAGPGPCPFETRHCFTRERLSENNFRVVSYNLLADLYADSDYSRTNLFPYCPVYALKIDYRKLLCMKEIIGYNADILCFQEVDTKIFDSHLKPVLGCTYQNYDGSFCQKSTSGEGLAIFFRNDRFSLEEEYKINIGEWIQKLPAAKGLWDRIKNNTKLVERLCERATTLQLLLLRSKDTQNYILVANTHLYYRPDADNIRLLQFGFTMLYIEDTVKLLIKSLNLNDNNQLGIIYCGDFNSVPECGIYKLMTEKYVGKEFMDWSSNMEQAVKNVSLSQPFEMISACGTPTYTNYTHLFAACLDYIFYQHDRYDVVQIVPLPSEEELKAHIAIPSVVFPSDHVALIADLKFKSFQSIS